MSIVNSFLYKLCEEDKYFYFNRLKPEWFIDKDDKELYNFIKDFAIKYKKLPSLNTLEENFGVELTLDEPLDYYVERFSKLVYRHLIGRASEKINKLGKEEGKEFEIAEIFGELYREAQEIKSITNIDIINAEELFLNTVDTLRKRQVHGTGITTGWNILDDITGGLQPGNIFVVMARVKMGKSMVLIKMANSALNMGHRVLFISMEMPKSEIGLRWMGLRRGLNLDYLWRNPPSEYVLDEMLDEINNLHNGNLFYSEGQFKKKLGEVIATIKIYEPDVVYIDGAYLIKPNRQRKSKWEEMSEIIEELKTTAIQLNIPIVASFQFNRNIKRKTVSVEDTAFENIQLSDAISQIASTGIAILQDQDGRDIRIIEVIGGRGGEKGRFAIHWDWRTSNFNEIPDLEV